MSKGELDIVKAEAQGSKILDSYMEFKDFYEKLKSNCGEVIIVENMAMIFHRDVLKFEAESQQNWESLKTLLN